MAKSAQFIHPFTDFGFKKLFGVADMANLSKEERQDYITSLKYYRDLKNVTDTAFQEGEIKGKIEGKAEGLAEGKIEGRREGLVEGVEQTKWKGIQKAIQRGKLSDVEIAEDFEVTLEYVQQLRASLH